ncbi:ComEA family DNA-binding protein [Microbispora sp. CA-135349]|uniref:ComEA family DNA-binding protein n=1 Tax=Microbispora sp. CA-135349 TaxID=3239953 RepID=UPI003D8EDEB3
MRPPFAQPQVPPPAPPPMPSPPHRPSSAPSFLWALSPLYTCGFGTPFTMLYAAIRKRSVWYGAAAAGYATATGAWIYLSEIYDDMDAPALASFLMVICMLTPWLFGTVHSLAVRKQVFEDAAPYSPANEQALAMAQYRRGLREQARELAQHDPAMARELRIGRPDLPRQYDDGGLVDVNRAPAAVIANLPGLTPALADQIVRVRDQVGGFVSAEDVSAAASLPPHLTADLAEYGIFLP